MADLSEKTAYLMFKYVKKKAIQPNCWFCNDLSV